MRIESRYALLTDTVLDPEELRKRVEDPKLGGVVVFCGEVRNETGDEKTDHLTYEAHGPMAFSQLERICQDAEIRWGGRMTAAHRIGRLEPGEIAVVTVAACPHRAQAFEACRYLIDQIKADVPIWKKEAGPQGSTWMLGDGRETAN